MPAAGAAHTLANALFAGPGEVRATLRQIDWSKTPLGPLESWPPSLGLALSLCLSNRFPMSVWWGPELIFIYNDAYAPILGQRHPSALGRSARIVWADVWPAIAEQVDAVQRGESSWNDRALRPTNRNGVMEDAWFTWSFSPIKDAAGAILGSFVVAIEVTEHVLRERELTATRDRLTTTLAAAEIGYWSLNALTGQVFADANLAQAFSVSTEIAANGAPLQVFIDAIHPEDRDRTLEMITDALATKDQFEAEYRLTPTGNTVRSVLARGQVARDETGRTTSMSGVLIDITDRKRSEQLLAAQNKVLQLVASDSSLSGILEEIVHQVETASSDAVASVLLVDATGRLRHGAAPNLPADFNSAIEGIQIGENVGTCGRAAFLGKAVITPDLAADPNWAPLKDLATSLGLLAVWSCPILSAHGKVLGTFGTYFRHKREPSEAERRAVDFLGKTAAIAIERTQAREELSQRDARFRQIADTMPQIVWGAGTDGVLDYYNRRWFEYINVPESDVAAARWDQYIHPEDLPPTYVAWQASLQSGENYQMEFRIRGADQGYRWFLTRALPIRDAAGKIVRWFGTCTDINDRKTAHEENLRLMERERAARVASENAGRMKDDFLATLSHELRTPLSPVLLLASEGAANSRLAPEVRADFAQIAKNVSLEARLIDDLLDLTRITRGKLALSVAPDDLHTVVQEALTTVAADIAEKQIEVITDFGATKSLIVGDATRLQQVFWNILRNSVKFTPTGGLITVSTAVTADRQRVEVLITDTGMGMNADEVGRLFNAFVQGDHAGETGSHRFGGLGLGLAISRMLVELHSGRIAGSSPGAGQGSSFSVQLPLAPENAVTKDRGTVSPLPTPAIRDTPLRLRRVLLVEDHEPTRTSLKQLLIRRHYEVTEAGSVKAALALAANQTFDLLLTDIGLPDGDGYTLMSQLNQTYSLKGIALTGYGMEEDIDRSRRAGFASHLTKPIRIQDLEAALAALTATMPSN